MPSTARVPEVGGRKPATMLRIVDLPQPEGPTIDTNSPAPTEKLALPIAGTRAAPVPYDFVTPLSSIMDRMVSVRQASPRALRTNVMSTFFSYVAVAISPALYCR